MKQVNSCHDLDFSAHFMKSRLKHVLEWQCQQVEIYGKVVSLSVLGASFQIACMCRQVDSSTKEALDRLVVHNIEHSNRHVLSNRAACFPASCAAFTGYDTVCADAAAHCSASAVIQMRFGRGYCLLHRNPQHFVHSPERCTALLQLLGCNKTASYHLHCTTAARLNVLAGRDDLNILLQVYSPLNPHRLYTGQC